MTDKRKSAVAFHEAGHAVAAVFLNVPVKSATIVRGPGYLGLVQYKNVLARVNPDTEGMSDRVRSRIERCIIVGLAGPLAQKRAFPRSLRKWHSHRDYADACDLAVRVSGSAASATAFLKWLETRTGDLLDTRWQCVERVAAELLRRNTLEAAEIEKLCVPRPEGSVFTTPGGISVLR